MVKRIIFMALLPVFLSGCFTEYEVHDITAQSGAFKRLPSIMQQFPVLEAIETPLYSFEMRDGPRSPSGKLHYRTKMSAAEITQHVTEHLVSLGCLQQPSESDEEIAYHCGLPTRRVFLRIKANSSYMHEIALLFIETTPEFEEVSF